MNPIDVIRRERELRDTYPLTLRERLSAYRHGMTARDYILFGAALDDPRDDSEYLTQIEHQRLVAANDAPHLLQNKFTTSTRFGDLMANHWTSPSAVRARGMSEVIVKPQNGVGGRGVERVDVDELPEDRPGIEMAVERGTLYCEPIEQAQYSHNINPAAVNTIRVITVYNGTAKPHIVGAVHRFGTTETAPTDNWSGGGMATPINLATGRMGALVRHTPGDRTPDRLDAHPETGVVVAGEKVTHWEAVKDVATRAARIDSRNRYVGWDIAVTPTGPVLIEGNVAPHLSLSQIGRGLYRHDMVQQMLRASPGFFSMLR